MSLSDPNGWVRSPPTTFVQVVQTSQEALNGSFALVLAFESSKNRYVVLLTESQRQIALKPDNLKACSSYIDQMRAQYQMVMHNPDIQRQIQNIWSQIQRAAPFLKTPNQLLATVGAVLLASLYFLGFSRTLLWMSFAAMAALLVGPVYTPNLKELALNRIPARLKLLLRQSQWPLAHYIADRDYLVAAFVALVLAIFVSGMLPKSGASPAGATPASWVSRYWSPSASPPPPSGTVPLSALDREHYYKLGFDDATQQHPFGHSLEKPVPRTLDETTLDLESSDGFAPVPPRRASRRWFSVSNLMTLAYTGNTLYQLGTVPGGRWSFDAFRRNAALLPSWKLGIMALSVYRVVSTLW